MPKSKQGRGVYKIWTRSKHTLNIAIEDFSYKRSITPEGVHMENRWLIIGNVTLQYPLNV